MTKTQKSQIQELRKKGVGYGEIAQRLKMPRSTIASHCRRYGMGSEPTKPKQPEPTPIVVKREGFSKHRDIVCTVKVTFEPWKPKAV